MDLGKAQQYKNVATSDDTHELLSDTDVDEAAQPLRDTEKSRKWRRNPEDDDSRQTQDGRPHHSRTRRWVARWRRYRWLIDTLLILVNISLSMILVKDVWQEKSVSTIQVGGDFSGTGPDLPTKVVKFDADRAFVPENATDFLTDDMAAQWTKMLPEGSGWAETTPDVFFTTSMTHQLHCVFMMARVFAGLEQGKMEKVPKDYKTHFLHCVDYLRQGIMCSGDLAMEPHTPNDSDDNGPGDGSWAGYHVCKDYSHVIPFLEEQIADGTRMVLPIDD